MIINIHRGNYEEVIGFLKKYADYVGAAVTVWMAHSYHFFGYNFTFSPTFTHYCINVVNTALLAFVGVAATEVAKWCIKKFKNFTK